MPPGLGADDDLAAPGVPRVPSAEDFLMLRRIPRAAAAVGSLPVHRRSI